MPIVHRRQEIFERLLNRICYLVMFIFSLIKRGMLALVMSLLFWIFENEYGHNLYLIGYEFIPAQDFHLPFPDNNTAINTHTWPTLEGYK